MVMNVPLRFGAHYVLIHHYDPFDPTDDIVENGVVFWANNTTGAVDTSQIHRWRLNTNDFYTGTTYANLAEVHPFSPSGS